MSEDQAKKELADALRLQLTLIEMTLRDHKASHLKAAIVIWNPNDPDGYGVALSKGAKLGEVQETVNHAAEVGR